MNGAGAGEQRVVHRKLGIRGSRQDRRADNQRGKQDLHFEILIWLDRSSLPGQ
jgi:hypothetical protein